MANLLIALGFFFGLFPGDSTMYMADHELYTLRHNLFWDGACYWSVSDAGGMVDSGILPGGATRPETDRTPGLYCYAGSGGPLLQAWSSDKSMPGIWHWLPMITN